MGSKSLIAESVYVRENIENDVQWKRECVTRQKRKKSWVSVTKVCLANDFRFGWNLSMLFLLP